MLKPDPANPNTSNKSLKVLDISYNPITRVGMKSAAEMMEFNRTLEYLGVAKCKLDSEAVTQVLDQIGRIPFP